MNYPLFRKVSSPGEVHRFICVASPTHAVDIFETTDPSNFDPLGFEYRILRSRPTVKRCENIGVEVSKTEWFNGAAEMMLTHLGSITDLIQLCDMRRESARMQGNKADYSRIINSLQEIKPSRRQIVRRRLERGDLKLLG